MYGSEGSDSPVQAEDAPGRRLQVALGEREFGASSASDGGGGGAGGNLKVGALAVAVAAAVVFGFRRLLRRN